jgi:hypothetical protein
MTVTQRTRLDELMTCELHTGVAWALKNIFREFWKSPTELRAEVFFDSWCELVEKSGLKQMIKVKEINGSTRRQYNKLLQTQSLERRVGGHQQQDSAVKSKFERI